jgi:hypothetical protein
MTQIRELMHKAAENLDILSQLDKKNDDDNFNKKLKGFFPSEINDVAHFIKVTECVIPLTKNFKKLIERIIEVQNSGGNLPVVNQIEAKKEKALSLAMNIIYSADLCLKIVNDLDDCCEICDKTRDVLKDIIQDFDVSKATLKLMNIVNSNINFSVKDTLH